MIKKIAFYVFIVAALAAAVWGYFRLKESKEPTSSVTEHIPADALCIIETKSAHELINQVTRQSLIWNSLQTETVFSKAQNGIRYLDSLINANKEIAGIIGNNSVYWSFIKDGKNTESLIQFKFKEQNNEALFNTFFNAVFTKSSSVSSFDVYDVTMGKHTWLACCQAGIVYFCSDVGVLRKAIELDKKSSISENPAYIELVKLNGRQNTQVYYNHTLAGLFNKTYFTRQSVFNSDVQLNELTFTGFLYTDSLSFLHALKDQEASGIRSFEYLPDGPACLKAMNVNDPGHFYNEYEKQKATHKNAQKNKTAWKLLTDSALYDIKTESFDNIDREIITASYRKDNNTFDITAIKLKDIKKAEDLMKLMTDTLLPVPEFRTGKIKTGYRELFSFFDGFKPTEFMGLKEDALYFFSGNDALQYFIQSITASNLLGKNKDFMQYAEDNLFQECNFLYYENCDEMKKSSLPRLILSDELNTGDDVLSDISFTAKNYKTSMQFRLHATHAKEKATQELDKNALWSFAADTTINGGVYQFSNHLTGETELCFQDAQNMLYLISSTGNLIWKKQLEETITSKIYTVDIFKNGKFQILFNTTHAIHLLDRNANYVQGYPVKTPAAITSPITLLDYDRTKDYRLFIACADHKIYNYTLYGIKAEGFMPFKTEAEVTLPVSYCRVGASDYLVTADVAGKIYVFSRKGEGRIDLKNKVIQNLGHLYVLAGNNPGNTRLVYVDDKNNLLEKISLADKKEALKLGDELSGFETRFDLIDDDTQPDVLLYGNGAIYAYDLFSNKLLENYNEQAVYAFTQMASTANNDWIIGFDKAVQKVDLINKEGKLIQSIANVTGKPLLSNLYKNDKTYLVLTNGKKISCQEIN